MHRMANPETSSPSPPKGARPDWTIPQRWAEYTAADHDTWRRLFERQVQLLPGLVTEEFLRGIDRLGLEAAGIPDFEVLSQRLQRLTGWIVVAVPGLVPADVFFEHLSQRRFVAGSFIRRPEQLDYLQEPDVFHDVFGHVPLLADPVYADYLEAYGRGGLRAARLGALDELARLYWYTVEFGLVRDRDRLRIFGAGIVSSSGESHFALHAAPPLRIGFDLRRVMRTTYAIDDFQKNYFVIESFADLLKKTVEIDFGPIYGELARLPIIAPGETTDGDRFFPANRHTIPV